MLNFMNDVAKAWKAQSGYNYNRSRCNPCNPGYSTSAGSPNAVQRKPSLPYDVIQNNDSYQVFVDIPGLAKPDLKIRVSNPKSDKVQGASPRMLTISGERQAPLQEGYMQKQRLFGGFENVWELPLDAETEGINAKVTDGVLTVTVPKKQAQPEVDDSQEIFIS
jgi:HSP20 family protein